MIIDLNHERTLKFNTLVAAWAEQQHEHIGDNNSSAYTVDCDAYWELVDLGPSIIAYVMAEYAAEQDGWWHELLHELVHGQQGGGTFLRRTCTRNGGTGSRPETIPRPPRASFGLRGSGLVRFRGIESYVLSFVHFENSGSPTCVLRMWPLVSERNQEKDRKKRKEKYKSFLSSAGKLGNL